MLSEPEPNQAEPHSSVFGSATSPGLHGPTNKRARPPHRIEGNLSYRFQPTGQDCFVDGTVMKDKKHYRLLIRI